MEKPNDILELLRQSEADLESKLELVRKQIREWEEHSGALPALRFSAGEFRGLEPHQAVRQYMGKAKKATREQIVLALTAGGLFEGRRVQNTAKSVNTAITTLVNKDELYEAKRGARPQPDSVIEWPASPTASSSSR